MSALQKSIMKGRMPPKPPRPRVAPGPRRKDYTPVSWKRYFHQHLDVDTEHGQFRVYMTPEPAIFDRPRIITLHGGGYSGLSWSLFAEEITIVINCQVLALDLRGHGETEAIQSDDMSVETLAKDVELVIKALFPDSIPPLILVGHSMGGAIAVRVAELDAIAPYVEGLAVIDVVEGTAMDCLTSMQSFLRSRPTHFRTIEHAIEWCVRSGQVRNVDSARVSMPSQIINIETGQLATREVETYVSMESTAAAASRHQSLPDRILEEDEEEILRVTEQASAQSQQQPSRAMIVPHLSVDVAPETEGHSAEEEQSSGLFLSPEAQETSAPKAVEAKKPEQEPTEPEAKKFAREMAMISELEEGPSSSSRDERGSPRHSPDPDLSDRFRRPAVVGDGLRNRGDAKMFTATMLGTMGVVNAKMAAELSSEVSNYRRAHANSEPFVSALFDYSANRNAGSFNRYTWRIDLSRTEPYWPGWFRGLSSSFLRVRAPRLLLLASINGLDKELMVGQMQGKFQLQVLTRCGHAVHEDNPGEVARAIAAFALRYRLTEPTAEGEQLNLTGRPGC